MTTQAAILSSRLAATTRVSRRRALAYAWWAAFGLVTASAAGAIGGYLWPNLKQGVFGSRIVVGRVDDLGPVGSVTYYAEAQTYLSRVPEGVIALWRKCPHLGCVVPWEPALPSWDAIAPNGMFACPCHGSEYDRYGVVHKGPAPRPMDWFPMERTADGTLIVDTGKVQRRPEGLDLARQVFPL